MPLLTGDNIANIERVKFETEDTPAVVLVFETATSATFTPKLSEGVEQIQRVKNSIMGLIKTEDLPLGYDLTLEDPRLIAAALALIDGGSVTPGTGDWTKYEAPTAGQPVTRKKFTTTLYTSDRDTDGAANAYHAWKFPGCKGSPVGGTFKDGDFAPMSYKISSRVPKGVSPLTVERVEELPAVT